MRRIFSTLISLALFFVFAIPAWAQSAVEVKDVSVDYDFGEQVFFRATLQPASSIQEAYLFFQALNETSTHTVPLTVAEDGRVEYRHDVHNALLRPFARVFFWYKIVLASGETVDSMHFYFDYVDDRYPWQSLEGDNLRVHWYAGDMAFGQSALDAARAGLQSIAALLPVSTDNPVDVYIYASAADVQDALGQGGYTWVAGHASPDLGTVLVSITPGEAQSIEMERQIPHELAHVMLYRVLGESYNSLPNWLVEGLATMSEQYPNSDYTQVLTVAVENDALLDISSLCGPFPVDASGAILAYAESASFTRYLHDTYGASGLQSLMNTYADGVACDQGAQRALGLPLEQLDRHWRQAALGEDIGDVALQNLLPYAIVLLLILIIPAWRLGLDLQKKEQQENVH